jgi:hypothetical protein
MSVFRRMRYHRLGTNICLTGWMEQHEEIERCPGLGNGEDRYMVTIPWTDNFETACQQAGQDQKLVLLDFFSPT